MLETTPSQDTKQSQPASRTEAAPAVTCAICNAAYIPAPTHQSLRNAPSIVVESAFMSICHYCFRCRRPACPQCWDAVHGVCGACDQDARLPFRLELIPLDGVLFPPATPIPQQEDNSTPSPFTCVRQGRFQMSTPIPPSGSRARLERFEQATGEPTNKVQVATQPATSAYEQQLRTEVHNNNDIPLKRARTGAAFVERVLTGIVLFVLLSLILLIVAAEYSSSANSQILRLLHVDIRAEIAYVVHLIHLLH